MFCVAGFPFWAELHEALVYLGHSTKTVQNVEGWLQRYHAGLPDGSTSATRDRYWRILASVDELYSPGLVYRRKTADEVHAEIAEVDAWLSANPNVDSALAADGVYWWRAKLEGVTHGLPNPLASKISQLLRKTFGSPDPLVQVWREWGDPTTWEP